MLAATPCGQLALLWQRCGWVGLSLGCWVCTSGSDASATSARDLRMASGRWGKQECESALAESRSCRLLASVLVAPLSFLVARSGITVLLLCSPNALALLPSSAILFIIRNTSYAVSYFTISSPELYTLCTTTSLKSKQGP